MKRWLNKNTILRYFKLASGPEMISLAGGMPNPTKFPFDSLNFGIEGKQIALSDAQVAQDAILNFLF